jgi:hypothetical protein
MRPQWGDDFDDPDWSGLPSAPPSWLTVCVFVGLVAAGIWMTAPIWLPAYDQGLQWLDAPRAAIERIGQ